MDNSLTGKAKELGVAALLVRNGLYVFFPLVDRGVDLVVTNGQLRLFIPVQVKYRTRDPALNLTSKDVERFVGTRIVLDYVIGSGPDQRSWFVPFQEWQRRKKTPLDRRDGMAYVTISENEAWLDQYKDDAGVQRAFRDLLK